MRKNTPFDDQADRPSDPSHLKGCVTEVCRYQRRQCPAFIVQVMRANQSSESEDQLEGKSGMERGKIMMANLSSVRVVI